MKVAAFVPIRLNNERLPGKNTLMLGDKPLCRHILSTLTRVEGIGSIYVFCSDDSIKKHLPPGIEFLRRDSWLDSHTTKGLDIIKSFVAAVDADIYIMTHATSPFIKAESLLKGLEAVKNSGYDSALSVQCFKTFAWYKGKPLNYNPSDFPRTQDIEPVFIETSGFYIFKKEVVVEYGRRIGNNPYFVETDGVESIDIDWPEDFEFAKLIHERQRGEG